MITKVIYRYPDSSRNSKSIEMVFEQVERSCCVDLESKADIYEKQRLEKARANLTERQLLLIW